MQENKKSPYFYIASSSSGPYFYRYDKKEDEVYLSSKLNCIFGREAEVRKAYYEIVGSCNHINKNLGLKCYMVYSDYNIVQFDPEPATPKPKEEFYYIKTDDGRFFLLDCDFVVGDLKLGTCRTTDFTYAKKFRSKPECLSVLKEVRRVLWSDVWGAYHIDCTTTPKTITKIDYSNERCNSEVEKLESEICDIKEKLKDLEHKSKVSKSTHEAKISDLQQRLDLAKCHIEKAYANIKDIINGIKTS